MKDDWAISVGISYYPGLESLDGPENDARAFHEWLRSPDGGDVPAERSTLIVTSDHHSYPPLPEPPVSPYLARPSVSAVQDAFDTLEHLSGLQNDERRRGPGPRVGRRLYLYFAGHGFDAVQPQQHFDQGQAVFLTAEAGPKRLNGHVSCSSFARSLREGRVFDEVILFMDCCRSEARTVGVNFAFTPGRHPNATRVKYLNGFAANRNGRAREVRDRHGKVRGVFTLALLEALSQGVGAANGDVTAAGLEAYVPRRVLELLQGEGDVDSEPERLPQFDYNRAAPPFVLTRTAPAAAQRPLAWRAEVKVRLRPSDVGAELRVLFGALSPVQTLRVRDTLVSLSLEPGVYAIEVAGDVRCTSVVTPQKASYVCDCT